MELWLAVRPPQGPEREFAITFDAGHTVEDLVAALARHLDTGEAELEPWREDPVEALRPDATVAASGLRTGEGIVLVPRGGEPPAPPPGGAVTLAVVGGPASGTTFALGQGRHRLGRAAEADLTVEDPFVSRRHLDVEVGAEGVRVTDAGSSNGTFLAGRRIDGPTDLRPGEMLEVGASLLAWHPTRPPPEPPATKAGRVTYRASPSLTRALDLARPEVLAAALLRDRFPDLATLHARARHRSRGLWEGAVGQGGLLSLRVGWGSLPATALPAGDRPAGLGPDAVLHAAPLTVGLRAHSPLILLGGDEGVQAVARALVAQAAARYRPSDLAIIVAVDGAAQDDWAWAGWLPHTWEAGRLGGEHVAVTAERAARLLARLADAGGDRTHLLVLDPRVAGHDLVDRVLAAPHVAAVCLGPLPDLFADRAARVELDPGTGAVVVRAPDGAVRTGHGADGLSRRLSLAFARHLAPLEEPGLAGGIPDSAGALDLLDLGHPDARIVTARWRTADPELRVVVGAARHGPAVLDLAQPGAHALVSGGAGMGKTELLRMLVAAAASGYPPDRVGFVCLDAGGGGLGPLAALPHVAGEVAGLETGPADRLRVALERELAARDRLLRETEASTVGELRAEAPGVAPASLVVIVDDLVAVAVDRPDLLRVLEDLVRRGRRLDLHLVASLPHPGGATASVLAGVGTRIALWSPDPKATADFFGDPAAVGLLSDRPGHGLLRQGGGRLQDFQCGWTGGRTAAQPMGDVRVFDLVAGRVRRSAGSTTIMRTPAPSQPDADLLVAAVVTAAGERAGGPVWQGWLGGDGLVEERVERALMFTDIVGSTDLIEEIGDAAWCSLVRWHDATLRQAFALHSGEEVTHTGDGFFVAFTDPPRAVECAVAIQRSLAEQRAREGSAPDVRIGIHVAEATWDGTYRGRGVHAAARVSALAGPGEVVVSRSAYDAAGGQWPVAPFEPATLKGIREPVEVARLRYAATDGG